MRIGSIVIFHLSKLWKGKFLILRFEKLLVRLQGKFEIGWSLLEVKGRIHVGERTVGAGDREFVPVVLWLKHKRGERRRRWYVAYQIFLQSLPQGFHPHWLLLGHRSLNRLHKRHWPPWPKKCNWDILTKYWLIIHKRGDRMSCLIVRSDRTSAPAGECSSKFSANSRCHWQIMEQSGKVFSIRQLQGAEFPPRSSW